MSTILKSLEDEGGGEEGGGRREGGEGNGYDGRKGERTTVFHG